MPLPDWIDAMAGSGLIRIHSSVVLAKVEWAANRHRQGVSKSA